MNYAEIKEREMITPKYRIKYRCLECYEAFIQTFVNEDDYNNNSKCPVCNHRVLEVLSHEMP